jgi:hypothetical protein
MMKKVGDRLAWAIEQARPGGWSINRLHRELQAAGVRGSSYGSVRNYIAGRAEPPLEFLHAAADVLGVRREYLRDGKEPATKAARALTARRTESEPPKGMRLNLPSFPGLSLTRGVRDSYYMLSGWWTYALESGAVSDIPSQPGAGAIGAAWHSPLEALGIDASRVSPAELEEYVATVSGALRRVLRSISPPLPEETPDGEA